MHNASDLTEGRIVHISLDGVGHCIPAIVIRVWRDGHGAAPANGVCNVRAFYDGTNDRPATANADGWITSITAGEPGENYRWHWPERGSSTP